MHFSTRSILSYAEIMITWREMRALEMARKCRVHQQLRARVQRARKRHGAAKAVDAATAAHQ
eukprot:6205112-Pleurochrysis_carterae.AAC.2